MKNIIILIIAVVSYLMYALYIAQSAPDQLNAIIYMIMFSTASIMVFNYWLQHKSDHK